MYDYKCFRPSSFATFMHSIEKKLTKINKSTENLERGVKKLKIFKSNTPSKATDIALKIPAEQIKPCSQKQQSKCKIALQRCFYFPFSNLKKIFLA